MGRNSILILRGEQHLRQRKADAAAVSRRRAQALDGHDRRDRARGARHLGARQAAEGPPADAGGHARGDPARDLRQPRPRAARRAAGRARHDGLDVAARHDVARQGRAAVHDASSPPSSASTPSSTTASTTPATATRSSTCSRARARKDATNSSRCSPPATRRRRPRSRGRSSGWRAIRPTLHTDAQIDAFVKEVLRTRPGALASPRAGCCSRTRSATTRCRRASTSHRASTSRTARGHVHPVRRRRAPLRRRRVRHARDARGAARRRRPVHACSRAGTRRADAPPQRHARARAWSLDHPADPLA